MSRPDVPDPAGSTPAADRWTTGAAITACVAFPVLEVAAIGVGVVPGALLPAVIATACYLPLLLRIVIVALRGHRPRGAWWTVGGIAVVLVVSVSTVGVASLAVFPALAVAAMLLVRPARAPAVLLSLAAATALLALVVGGSVQDLWYMTEVLWLYALVALVAAVRRLEQARRELAEQALLRGRLRIDEELRATVGVALTDLAARADRVSRSAETDRAPAELTELVAASRRSLADARRVVSGYQRPALHAELDSAVALLAAAGIPARAVCPDGELPTVAGQAVQRDLRSAVTRLLRDGSTGQVVLRVAVEHGTHRLTVLPDVDLASASTVGRRG